MPAEGMGAIARQLANQLPANSFRTGVGVDILTGTTVRLTSGESLTADKVVVACEAPAAAKLLGETPPPPGRGVTCLYFDADDPPINDPILALNGDGSGPINNLCVPSLVTPTYAPNGRSLVSVTVLGMASDNVEFEVRSQLLDWFGNQVECWRHLRTYRIPFALPSQAPPVHLPARKYVARDETVFVCGDYLDNASIQGAMESGRRAAEAIVQRLGR